MTRGILRETLRMNCVTDAKNVKILVSERLMRVNAYASGTTVVMMQDEESVFEIRIFMTRSKLKNVQSVKSLHLSKNIK